MGIFSTKKKTYVSSTSYNLAGDEEDRPQFLKSLVVGHTFKGSGDSLSSVLNSAYLNGPGIKLRNFPAWARRTDYDDTIGLASSTIQIGNQLDLDLLADYISSLHSGKDVSIQSAEILPSDYSYWVDEYLINNYPDRVEDEYTYDYSTTTGEITLVFETGPTVVFPLVGYEHNARYIYASYTVVERNIEGPVSTGSTIVLDDEDDFPSVTGWDEIYYNVTPIPVSLDTVVTTTHTYSDGRPDETSSVTTTESDSYDEIHGKWERTTYNGQSGVDDSIGSLKEIQYQDQVGSVVTNTSTVTTTETIAPGVTKTTTVVTETDSVDLDKSYRIDEVEIIDTKWSPITFLRYQFDSGEPTLDAMFAPEESSGEFYPFIPIRLNNAFISPTYLPDVYGPAKAALKKSIGGKYDSVVESIADNDALGDIDYAYVMFGVSLNTKENASRLYIYKLFQSILYDISTDPSGDYSAYQIAWADADAKVNAWIEWKAAQSNPADPLYGEPEPPKVTYPEMPERSLRVFSEDKGAINFDIGMSWTSISETTEIGVAAPGAKKGDVFLVSEDEPLYPEGYYTFNTFFSRIFERDTLLIKWQDEVNQWRQLRIVNLVHTNNVYRGNVVSITAKAALTDEDESGFIVPLHEGVYKAMGVVDGTQMSVASSYIIFNSYKVVKTKWYRTGVFKIVVLIVVIAIAIVFPATAGLAIKVGTALGFTGTLAIIVGVVAVAAAASILTSIIVKISVALFGEKVGAVIGSILSVVAVAYGGAAISGQSLSTVIAEMSRAELIIHLSNAVGGGISAYYQAAANLIGVETQNLLQSYETEMDKIQALFNENLGTSTNIIDPTMLTNAATTFIESSSSFLERTLMTGSEVAELSQSLVNNFASITLSTDLTL